MKTMLDKLLWNFVDKYPNRRRIIHTDGEPYLLRFYIKHNGVLPGIYLHYFYRGDEDRDLHNHPWKKSWSLILTGGYTEERLDPNTNQITKKIIEPGTINKIHSNDFHRVDLHSTYYGCWTLFISGKEVQNWGFKIRETGEYIPHKDYIGEEFKDEAPGRRR